jgi:hypothetical protein
MILIQQDAHYVINNDVMARTIKDNLYRNIVEGFFAEYLYVLYLLMKDKPIVAYEGEVCIDETRHAILSMRIDLEAILHIILYQKVLVRR